MPAWWEEHYDWYLFVRIPGTGLDYVGPFKTMTKAFLHRKAFGPRTAEIEYRSRSMFGEMFPPMSPEQHRYLQTTKAINDD